MQTEIVQKLLSRINSKVIIILISIDILNHKQQQPMILKRLIAKPKILAPFQQHRISYSESTFRKIVLIIQNILNKMSNEDSRSFSERISENVNKNVPIKQQPPKNELEAEKRFTNQQQTLSKYEKGRLKRIDEILGTQTHFHESKIYQQRIDSQNVLQLSQLHNKYKQKNRAQLDFLNPQIPKSIFQKRKRKVAKWMKNLRTYPKGNSDLTNFQQKSFESEKQSINDQLIKFLSEEVLFTRLSLSELELTMESIKKQKVISEEEGWLFDEQLDRNKVVIKEHTYFKPSHLMSIYRIENNKYSNKLIASVDSFIECIANKQGNVQQIINLDEIYECLKNYYFDSRVNQYLAKIQNKQLNYFFSDLQISPDGNSVFMVIDLLGTKKQYVGIYKQIHKISQTHSILPENIVFNFKPEVALRNDGQLYYIQRSQQGLYIELVKTKFASFSTKSSRNKTKQQKGQKQKDQEQQGESSNAIERTKKMRNEEILYKCKPFEQLRIMSSKEAKVSTQKYSIMSSNLVIEQRDVESKLNNRIYLALHNKGEFKMQLLTANNARLAELLKDEIQRSNLHHLSSCQTNPNFIYTECIQIMDVGYVLVRYWPTDSYIKYGNAAKFAKFATLVPYAKAKFSQTRTPQITNKTQQIGYKAQQIQHKEFQVSNSSIEFLREDIIVSEGNDEKNRIMKIELPSQESISFIAAGPAEEYKLDLGREQIIFACNQEQFIQNLVVLHSSLSNVYLLANKSVESVYNRHSLHIQPLRNNVAPYSLYLDGFPIFISDLTHQGRLSLQVMAPLLPISLEYTMWKKQIIEKPRSKLYTETITIREEEQGCEVIIKVVGKHSFLKQSKEKYEQAQPVILYLPSKNQRLNELQLQKLLEKGVVFVQIVKCRGIFGTNAVDFLRGSKQLFKNYVDDIREAIIFAKQHIGEHVGVYAEGPTSCLATLLLNIKQNQFNELFDCSVLHQGVYDFKNNQAKIQQLFGSDSQFIEKTNPYTMQMIDPTRSSDPNQKQEQYKINNLQNVVFSTLDHAQRAQSRKFINKLRVHNKIIYENVFLKQFDTPQEKDVFNLAYLYKVMNDFMTKNYKQVQKEKYKQINQKGQSLSRDSKDKNRNKQEENQ